VVVKGSCAFRLPLANCAGKWPLLTMMLQYLTGVSLLSVVCFHYDGHVGAVHTSIERILFPRELDFLFVGTAYCWIVWGASTIVGWVNWGHLVLSCLGRALVLILDWQARQGVMAGG